MNGEKLTDRERQVYEVLCDHPMGASQIARKAGIKTTSPAETAAHYCIRLVKKGLAEKCGTRMFPGWRLPLPGAGLGLAKDGESVTPLPAVAPRLP
jgi:hypothetical protein